MSLDTYTLLVVTAFVSGLVGILLALACLRTPGGALPWWSASFVAAALGTIAFLLYGNVHDFVSIDLGHALVVLSCGLALAGARVFNGRPPNLFASIAGAVLWVFVAITVGEHLIFADRILAVGLVTCIYFILASRELGYHAKEVNVSRKVAAGFLVVHAVLVLARAPFPVLESHHTPADALVQPGFMLMSFEGLIYSVGLSFLLLAMTMERSERKVQKIALTDPLTGVANRRAVELNGEKLLAAGRRDERPTALLAFDLDHFKKVNDTFGHKAGDLVLQRFAALVQAQIRPSDLFGRMGGEEFVALLPGLGAGEAVEVAERIRGEFAAVGRNIGGHPVGATVSIGIAVADASRSTLEGLLAKADTALYRAKDEGRNAVRVAAAREGERAPDRLAERELLRARPRM